MARSPIMCRKERGGFFPADAWAQAQYDAIPDGKELSVRVSVMSARGKTEREGTRGLLWAGIHLLSENIDSPLMDSPRKAYEYLLSSLGYVRPRFRVDGSYEMIPISTSEEAMPDEEHAIVLDRMRAWAQEHLGYDPWQLWIDQQEAQAIKQVPF